MLHAPADQMRWVIKTLSTEAPTQTVTSRGPIAWLSVVYSANLGVDVVVAMNEGKVPQKNKNSGFGASPLGHPVLFGRVRTTVRALDREHDSHFFGF